MKGTAEVTINDLLSLLRENELISRAGRRDPPPEEPRQDPARADRGRSTGSYLGEDVIVRFDYDFGRG